MLFAVRGSSLGVRTVRLGRVTAAALPGSVQIDA